MPRIFKKYLKTAQHILDNNWLGSSTKPSPSVYPHQWNWDSGFIAIGKSLYNSNEAMLELETLFAAQWKNGMLPQIVFDKNNLGNYFPEPDFWQAERSENVPKGILCSGITMPPIHAFAVERIYQNSKNKKIVKEFIKNIYPKLIKMHEYFYNERDPFNEGLVYIRHPWESGIDNSPTWDTPLKNIKIRRKSLPKYQRKDLNYEIDVSMRPTDDEYDKYVYLVDLFRLNNYDEKSIFKRTKFLIQDPLFNSILCRSNLSLIHLAELIGESSREVTSWYKISSKSISNKLWNNKRKYFDAYDLKQKKRITVHTIAGFMPLFANAATKHQAKQLYKYMNSSSFCALHQGNCFTIPNYDTRMKDFDRKNYWRGPVWININWMLAEGLSNYGYKLKADSLRKDLIQLPVRFGFYEYYDSFDGTGYGSKNFSWTAALLIDLINNFYGVQKSKSKILLTIPSRYFKKNILNKKIKSSITDFNNLSSEIFYSIKEIREKYYNTERGIVDYDRLKKSKYYKNYQDLTAALQSFDCSKLKGRREKLAFWMNIYNTIVIDGIISLGIKYSVKEVNNFFQKIYYQIGKYKLSADDIEHGILRANSRPWFRLRKQFGILNKKRKIIMTPLDPRIHFALVCGSRSCAPINFYDAKNIYEQLDNAAVNFINSSEVIIVPEENKIIISEIFKWYKKDFGGRTGILDFIIDYLRDEKALNFIQDEFYDLDIEYLYYDWNLNR